MEVELKRADVLNLLAGLDLKTGDTYTLIVHSNLKDDTSMPPKEVTISIVGKKK